MWELFTSECSHLAVLTLLCYPFLHAARALQNLPPTERISLDFQGIDLDKLFVNVEELQRLSHTFAFVLL